MSKIPVKYETYQNYEFFQPLFQARKNITDKILDYGKWEEGVTRLDKELVSLDAFILRLAGLTEVES